MTRLQSWSALAATLTLAVLLTGCGGGGGGGNPGPNPPAETATLEGRVVRADNPTVGIPAAEITVRDSAGQVIASGASGANGVFRLTNVPVGVVTVVADTPEEGEYTSQQIPNLALSDGDDVQLTVTVLPETAAAPTVVLLTPTSAQVDLHGQVAFTATVSSSNGAMEVTPSFMLLSPIGTVSSTGVFTATALGSGQLVAVLGSARATANITVVPARPPDITSFLVAPTTLTASGGPTTITVAVTDGDGIDSVIAEIYTGGGDPIMAYVPLDERTTDTYRLTYDFPANSNRFDSTGHQADQVYTIRAVATDRTGVSSYTNRATVTVQGREAPPGPI